MIPPTLARVVRPFAILTIALTAVRAQDAPKSPATPAVRVTLRIDSVSTAQFDARDFDLSAFQAGASSPTTEIRLVKRAGAHTGVLLSLSINGIHIPSAVIDVLDSLGTPALTFRLSDVAVASDHLSLSTARASMEQQRISQQEALSALTADSQEAQRQLVMAEELSKTRSTTRVDLARARDHATDLQRRIDLLKQRQALLARQIGDQGPLDETVVLHFARFEIDSREPGGRAAIDIVVRPRAERR